MADSPSNPTAIMHWATVGSNVPDARQPAPAEVTEEARRRSPNRRRLAEQAGHHDPVHQSHTHPYPICAFEQRPCLLEPGLRLVPHADHRGERIGFAEAGAGRRLTLDPK